MERVEEIAKMDPKLLRKVQLEMTAEAAFKSIAMVLFTKVDPV
jgi:hypothetical protein